MIQIKSNIAEVIARLQFYQREFPQAMVRALKPSHWLEPLRLSAALTLSQLVEEGEQVLVAGFVDTILATAIPDGAAYEMSRPKENKASVVSEAQGVMEKYREKMYAREGAMPDLLERQTVEDARSLLAEWVHADKRKNDEDIGLEAMPGKYNNQLVERIWWIFGMHPDQKASDVTSIMQYDAEMIFQGGIKPWLEKNEKATSPEMASDWLQAVLAAWKSLFEIRLPEVVAMELDKLRAEMAK